MFDFCREKVRVALERPVSYRVQRSKLVLNEAKDLLYPFVADPSKLRMRAARTWNLEPYLMPSLFQVYHDTVLSLVLSPWIMRIKSWLFGAFAEDVFQFLLYGVVVFK